MFLQVPRVAKSSNRWGRTTRNFPPRRLVALQWRDLFVKWMCLVDGSNRASSDAYGTSGDLTWWKMDEPGQFIDYLPIINRYKCDSYLSLPADILWLAREWEQTHYRKRIQDGMVCGRQGMRERSGAAMHSKQFSLIDTTCNFTGIGVMFTSNYCVVCSKVLCWFCLCFCWLKSPSFADHIMP